MSRKMEIRLKPYLSMVNEPESKFRFRYASEAGSHGGILAKGGETSVKKSKKTYPTVKLENYHGKEPVVARVSLYTFDHEKHVLELKGKSVIKGMSYEDFDKNFEAKFNNLVIVNKKKDEVHEILMKRKIKSLGYSISSAEKEELERKYSQEIKANAKAILSSVLLCFEAFPKGNKNKPICEPLFSEPIYNQKSSLKIVRISRVAGSWRGGDEVILLCDKVKKGLIQVLFFEDSAESEDPWDSKGVFTPADIHHQVAITFKTPPYKENIEKTVNVCLCQDDDKSESVTFTYIPEERDLMTPHKKRKRPIKEEFQPVFINDLATPSSSSNDASSEFPMEDISVPFHDNAITQYLNSVDNTIVPHEIEVAGNNNFQGVISEMGSESTTELTDTMDVCEALGIDRLIFDPFINEIIEDEGIFNFDLLQDPTPSFETDGEYFKPELVMNQSLSLDCSNIVMNQSLSLDCPDMVMNQSLFLDCPDSLKTDSVDSSIVSKTFTSSDLADDLHKMSLLPRAEMAYENSRMKKGLDQNKNVNHNIAVAQMGTGSILKFLPHRNSDRDSRTTEKDKLECRKLESQVWEKCLKGLHWRDNLNNTVLHWAVFHHKKIELFLILDKRLHTNILNVQNHRKQTALHIAAEKKNERFVQLLLKYGADPNLKDADGNNCLHIAAKNEFIEGVNEIIRSPKFHEINAFNYDGLTPVHLAVIHQSVSCVCSLVTKADMNVLDQKSGKSVLHFAIEMLPFNVSHLLSEGCVDVNIQDFSGNTPLHLACTVGNLWLVELLLEYFADPLLKNFNQGLETSEQENSDSENTGAFDIFDINVEEKSPEVVDGQTPMDVATDPMIKEVLKLAIQRKEKAKCLEPDQSKCSSDASEMSKSVELCNLLDNQVDIASWKKVVECMGMDGSYLDVMLRCSSPSPSKAVLKYLKKEHGQNYMEVFKNLLEMAGLDESLKLVKGMC